MSLHNCISHLDVTSLYTSQSLLFVLHRKHLHCQQNIPQGSDAVNKKLTTRLSATTSSIFLRLELWVIAAKISSTDSFERIANTRGSVPTLATLLRYHQDTSTSIPVSKRNPKNMKTGRIAANKRHKEVDSADIEDRENKAAVVLQNTLKQLVRRSWMQREHSLNRDKCCRQVCTV